MSLDDVDALLAARRAASAGLSAAQEAARSGRAGGIDALLAAQAESDAIVDRDLLPRLRALTRLHAAIDRLSDLGPVSDIVGRAPAEAAATTDLDRMLLVRIENGLLVVEGAHVRDDPAASAELVAALQSQTVRVAYPLVEAEILRRRAAAVVSVTGDPRRRHAFADTLGDEDHVTAPIVLEGRVIGFFRGDRAPGGRSLSALDADALGGFAQVFARVFERAILHRRLRIQSQELRQIARWAEARTSDLSDRAIDLAADRDGEDEARSPVAAAAGSLRDLLTRRELEVLELMADGESNAAIGRRLVVSEGTVKFHVRNVLRKLQVANRAEATARYLRLTMPGAVVPGAPGT